MQFCHRRFTSRITRENSRERTISTANNSSEIAQRLLSPVFIIFDLIALYHQGLMVVSAGVFVVKARFNYLVLLTRNCGPGHQPTIEDNHNRRYSVIIPIFNSFRDIIPLSCTLPGRSFSCGIHLSRRFPITPPLGLFCLVLGLALPLSHER